MLSGTTGQLPRLTSGVRISSPALIQGNEARQIDSRFLGRWFGDSHGNLYEGEFSDIQPGPVSRCAVSSDPGCFDLETNEDADDWSDIEELFAALSDPTISTVEQIDWV